METCTEMSITKQEEGKKTQNSTQKEINMT